MSTSRLTTVRSASLLIGLLVLCFGVAALGGLSTAEGVRTWYPGLDKPPWTPPNGAFGPIWTVLYTAMAVALWDVVRREPWRGWDAAKPWLLQLALNLVWSPVFFSWHTTGLALAVITGLWLVIARSVGRFASVSRPAALAMLVYLAWVSVAWSLNAWVWWFNG